MRFAELLKAVLFGIVEGITEWLPISSTGHLIIINELVRLDATDVFCEFFLVAIQLGAIMAVPVVLGKKYFSPCQNRGEWQGRIGVFGHVIIGVIPAALVGFLFDDMLDKLFYNYITVAVTLILYGIAFLLIAKKNKGRNSKIKDAESLSFGKSFIIGLFQMLSLIPGTSRSGATFIGGFVVGASSGASAEFSFLMAVPIMLGATVLKGAKLILAGFVFSVEDLSVLIIASLASFLVSIASMKFLLDFVRKRSLRVFGIYRIILGFAVLLFFSLK